MFDPVILNEIRRVLDINYGTKYENGNPSNLGIILEHTTVLNEARVISIYLHLDDN